MDHQTSFYAAFASIVVMDSIMILACVLFFSLKNQYIILRRYSNYLVLLQVIFASIDMWNIFVVLYRDEDTIYPVMQHLTDYCVLWTYWTQYSLGIMPWMCIYQYRIIRHVMLCNRYIKNNKRIFPTKLFHLFSSFVILVPPLAIIAWISNSVGFGSAQYYDFGCGENLEQKISLVIWLFLLLIYMYILIIVVRKGTDDIYSDIYSAVKWTDAYGIVVLIVCVCIRYTDAIYDPAWKFAYILIRNSFFIFAFFVALGHDLLRAMINDSNYLHKMCNSFQFYDVIIYNIRDIHFSKTMMKRFIQFIREKDIIEETRDFAILSSKNAKKRNSLDSNLVIDEKKLIDPAVLSQCYLALVEFMDKSRSRKKGEDISDLVGIASSIATDYFENGKIPVPTYMIESIRKRLNKCTDKTFNYELNFILGTMDYYWGDEYFQGDKNSEKMRMTHRIKMTLEADNESSLVESGVSFEMIESSGVESDFTNNI